MSSRLGLISSGFVEDWGAIRVSLDSVLAVFRLRGSRHAVAGAALACLVMLPQVARAQGPMTNGENHAGSISVLGEIDEWTFTAAKGDSIAVRVGRDVANSPNPNFAMSIKLRRPDGVLVSSALHSQSTEVSVTNFNTGLPGAPLTGTYTVTVEDSGNDATGAYFLTLARTPAEFVVPEGDEGGPLASGANHVGHLHLGDIDTWTFAAAKDEVFLLNLGQFRTNPADPDLSVLANIFRPDGVWVGLASSSAGVGSQVVSFTAPLSGTYTVRVGALLTTDPPGDYQLTFAKVPGMSVVPDGDEGGPMTNGVNHTGAISSGDFDMWTFTAAQGENLSLAVGEIVAGEIDPNFELFMRLLSPTGTQITQVAGAWAAAIHTAAPVAGVYTAVVSAGAGWYPEGSYRLTLAKPSGNYVVEASDEGGPMTTGVNHPGYIGIGDLDQWSFVARAGDSLSVIVTEVIPGELDPAFVPRISLRRPDGQEVNWNWGASVAQINATAPQSGTYTVVVAHQGNQTDKLGIGHYELRVTGNTPIPANLVNNGDFSNGLAGWQIHATPSLNYIVANVTGGVLNFHRVAPPAGTTNQATVFREMSVALPSGAPVVAQFDMGNSSSVRKRVSVLLLDSNFSDLSVCTFWLPPSSPLRTYRILTHTTQSWANASIYFYAASAGSNGGSYLIDNVSVLHDPVESASQTRCVDALAPAPVAGVTGPELIVNGSFSGSGGGGGRGGGGGGAGVPELSPWGVFGTISHQLTADFTGSSSGVFEFVRPTSAPPAGVVLQSTGQAIAANQILTSTFQLGNSSAVRKRVTAILHDNDFSDLSACTFWLPPGQPLSTYTYRAYTTKAWTNATLSIYAATVGTEPWIRLDNVSLRQTPNVTMAGAECIEPAAGDAHVMDSRHVPSVGGTAGIADAARLGANADGAADTSSTQSNTSSSLADDWISDGFEWSDGELFAPAWTAVGSSAGTHTLQRTEPLDLRGATTAGLHLQSWLTTVGSRAWVQVSTDGVNWEVVRELQASDTWIPVDVRLDAYLGEVVFVGIVFDALPPGGGVGPDQWHVAIMGIDIDTWAGLPSAEVDRRLPALALRPSRRAFSLSPKRRRRGGSA